MSDDPFRYDDAPYVLGALDPAERAAFEAHLFRCAECRARVADAKEARGLLALVSGADVGDPPSADPMPDTLLPGLLRHAAREQRRRRLVTGTIGAAAAAAVVALVVAVWPATPQQSESKPAARQFTAVRSAPVAASGILVAKQWGTQINLECRYTRELTHGMAYRLVVIDSGQRRYDAGGWTLGDRPTEFTGGTQVRRDDIAAVQITLADGEPVLQLTP